MKKLEVEMMQDVMGGGWWASWGKCAAGILGGTGTGGLAGAGIGSVVPGLGTAAGAVIGGISGGLTGAVAAC